MFRKHSITDSITDGVDDLPWYHSQNWAGANGRERERERVREREPQNGERVPYSSTPCTGAEEFTIYNFNLGLYGVCRIVFEIAAAGDWTQTFELDVLMQRSREKHGSSSRGTPKMAGSAFSFLFNQPQKWNSAVKQ